MKKVGISEGLLSDSTSMAFVLYITAEDSNGEGDDDEWRYSSTHS
jgi:hypothetical protein